MRLHTPPPLIHDAGNASRRARAAAVATAALVVLSAAAGRGAATPPSLRQIGPEGGAIAALARAPLADAPLFAVSDGGDLFRLDNGQRWTRVRDRIRAVIPDPADARLVYALPDYGRLQMSRDGGTNWSADTGLNVEDPAALVLESARGLAYVATPGAVFRSRDDLRSWTAVLGRIADDEDATVQLALGTTPHPILYAYLPGERLLRSEDDGDTWISATLPALECNPFFYSCGSIAVDPRDARRLLVGAGLAIYGSRDGGDTWTPATILSDGLQLAQTIGDVAIDPNDAQRAYAVRGNGLVLSVDGGATWKPLATPLLQHVLIDPTDGQRLYAADGSPFGAGEGVWMSEDRGGHWQGLNRGLFATCIQEMLAVSPDTILAAPCDGRPGLRLTTDAGASWRPVDQGLPDRLYVGALAAAGDDARVYYAGLLTGGIYRSADGGEHWLPTNIGDSQVFDLAIAAGSSAVLYAALGRDLIWTTPDGGARWEASTNGLPEVEDSGQADRIVTDPADPRRAYAAVNYTNSAVPLFRTLDGGAHWGAVDASLQLQQVFDLAVSPADPRQIYATGFEDIYASSDAGATWHRAGFGGRFNYPIRLAADPLWPDTVYATSNRRVLRSDDRGGTWRVLLRDLPIDGSNEIVAVGEPRTLLLSTSSAGILAYGPIPAASGVPACSGDCDGDRMVSIAELITSVNIATGGDEIDACGPADTDTDDAVSIAELVAAVAVALAGCG